MKHMKDLRQNTQRVEKNKIFLGWKFQATERT